MVRTGSAIAAGLLLGAFIPASANATPIPEAPGLGPKPPAFIGTAAEANPVAGTTVPRHPFMAPNGRSNIHNDGYQTDAYDWLGPLGRSMQVTSTFLASDCASVTFDSRGRIVSVCVGIVRPTLRVLDPSTLETLASMDLPVRDPFTTNPTKLFTDFSGGGYFYLDDRDQAVVSTYDRHILTIRTADESGAPKLTVVRDVNLNGVIPLNDKLISALPDWSGRLWFVSVRGVVGTISADGATIRSIRTDEPVGNSFAVDDDGGVYIVSDAALYRYDASTDGTPTVTWRQEYDNDGRIKPGQTQAGSGTTPTVMDDGMIAITDNADPINVVVYRRDRDVSGEREICRIPVFDRGASSTDNSLVAAHHSLVVENNYGYRGPTSTLLGQTTKPGLERIDVDPDAGTCTRAWRSDEIAPSVVPKASLEAGLLYTYTKPPGTSSDPWYFTAIDFRTGRTVYKQLAGSGLGFNNNYAPITLGPDGTAYVGVLGGLVALRDGA
jgi:hypothetical protein